VVGKPAGLTDWKNWWTAGGSSTSDFVDSASDSGEEDREHALWLWLWLWLWHPLSPFLLSGIEASIFL